MEWQTQSSGIRCCFRHETSRTSQKNRRVKNPVGIKHYLWIAVAQEAFPGLYKGSYWFTDLCNIVVMVPPPSQRGIGPFFRKESDLTMRSGKTWLTGGTSVPRMQTRPYCSFGSRGSPDSGQARQAQGSSSPESVGVGTLLSCG